jgi:fibronectin type 3 domain-containing protein
LTFTPQASGSATANLSFTTAGSSSPFTAALTGSGAAPVQHSVNLFWDASSSSVSGYNVYRGGQSGGPYSKINATPVAGTTYTDSSIQAGQTYYYVTTSVGTDGMESGYSNQGMAVIPTP